MVYSEILVGNSCTYYRQLYLHIHSFFCFVCSCFKCFGQYGQGTMVIFLVLQAEIVETDDYFMLIEKNNNKSFMILLQLMRKPGHWS